MFSASPTLLPRISAATRFSFCAEPRICVPTDKRFLVADLAGGFRLGHQRLPFLSAAWPGK